MQTARQKAAHETLQALNVFTLLAAYSPILTGTIPLDIDIASSDLDIVCEAANLDEFARQVTEHFGHHTEYQIAQKMIRGELCVVAKFEFQDFAIEIFGQNRPVEQQNAYRHMLVEARLLEIGGERARQEIRQLKQMGLKTEPAFARYFHLEGDPYDTLLQLSLLDETTLRSLLKSD